MSLMMVTFIITRAINGQSVVFVSQFELSWPKDQSEKLIRAKLFGRQVLGPINFMFSTTMWRDRMLEALRSKELKRN